MSREKEIIKLISDIMPRSTTQANKLFEADCEIVRFGNSNLLYNIDQFSEEDLLPDNDPFSLGWNLAVGGMSDITACGGKPLYYAHSITINNNWTNKYIEQFSQGISAVLKFAETSFIGGDFNKSKYWNYTASVIGALEGEPLLRKGAHSGDIVYITGEIGTGNLSAFAKLNPGLFDISSIDWKFVLRHREMEIIKKYATSSIDTSDGLFNAINTIASFCNNGYILKGLPYIKEGVLVAKKFGIPQTLLCLGECGEYEILFTIKKADNEKFLTDAQNMGFIFYKIGEIADSPKRLLFEGNREIDLTNFDISARDYDNVSQYLTKLLQFTG